MATNNRGFSLIEIMVVLAITVTLLVSVGGIMTSSFKAKTSTDAREAAQNGSQKMMGEIKRNILDADIPTILCPAAVGDSISFNTKSGGNTILWCDGVTGKVASISAISGSYLLTDNGLTVRNCNNFVKCSSNVNAEVESVDINLEIGVTGGQADQFWTFVSKVIPR